MRYLYSSKKENKKIKYITKAGFILEIFLLGILGYNAISSFVQSTFDQYFFTYILFIVVLIYLMIKDWNIIKLKSL